MPIGLRENTKTVPSTVRQFGESAKMVTETDVKNALTGVQDPELGQNIVELGMVRGLRVTDGKVVFTLVLTNLSCPFKDRLKQRVNKRCDCR